MKTNIKATNIEITSAIEEYLNRKMAAVEKLIDPQDDSAFAQIELAKTTNHHRTGDVFRAEINLHLAGADFYVFSENGDLYSAIDAVKDEIGHEIRSWKDKKTSFIRKGGRKIKNIVKGLYRRGE